MTIHYKRVLSDKWPVQNPYLFANRLTAKGLSTMSPSGYPAHPHQGLEVLNIVIAGYVDYFDSEGACARYGAGDVFWMNTGSGIQHSEMYPLLEGEAAPLEIIQIGINLPKVLKQAPPSCQMHWREAIPVHQVGQSKVAVIAGRFAAVDALEPPASSWAKDMGHGVRILYITLDEGQMLVLDAGSKSALHSLYHLGGEELCLCQLSASEYSKCFRGSEGLYRALNGGDSIADRTRFEHLCTWLPTAQMATYTSSYLCLWPERGQVNLLILEGEPIEEPIVQYGPFVMNSRVEIQEAFWNYEITKFGGWPWQSQEPMHPEALSRMFDDGENRIYKPK